MKNKFLIPTLLIGFLTFYFSCQKDDTITKEQSTEQKIPIIKTVSYQEVSETFNRLTNKYKLDAFLDVGMEGSYL